MSYHSKIEWTGHSWNPFTGCHEVSEGCKNCYAKVLAERLRGTNAFPVGFDLMIRPGKLKWPLKIAKPSLIFVNSMSDLFHAAIPKEYMQEIFKVMEEAKWHTFQILTKRAERLAELAPFLPWPQNVWMGASVETQRWTKRIPFLLEVPATVRFLSLEPLLGPLSHLPLSGIHWVIAGGESGLHHRPIQADWVREIRDQCLAAKVLFFFKQWGGPTPKSGGRLLDGRTWDEMPAILRGSDTTKQLGQIPVTQGHA